jgi:hypothetical protein
MPMTPLQFTHAENYGTYRRKGVEAYPPAEWAVRRFWRRKDLAPSYHAHTRGRARGMAVELDARLFVFLEFGRWIVQCPDCNDAQFASFTDPRFMCVGCLNEAVGGAWRPVVWPDNAEAIERKLLTRKPRHGRAAKRLHNWQPSDGKGRHLEPDPTS